MASQASSELYALDMQKNAIENKLLVTSQDPWKMSLSIIFLLGPYLYIRKLSESFLMPFTHNWNLLHSAKKSSTFFQ